MSRSSKDWSVLPSAVAHLTNIPFGSVVYLEIFVYTVLNLCAEWAVELLMRKNTENGEGAGSIYLLRTACNSHSLQIVVVCVTMGLRLSW